jgi:hypothetical protein
VEHQDPVAADLVNESPYEVSIYQDIVPADPAGRRRAEAAFVDQIREGGAIDHASQSSCSGTDQDGITDLPENLGGALLPGRGAAWHPA